MPEPKRVNEILPQTPPEQKPDPANHTTRNVLIVFFLLSVCAVIGLIALLIGGSLLGIGAAQQNSRDTERISAAVDFNFNMAQFYTVNGVYPEFILFQDGIVQFVQSTATNCPSASMGCIQFVLTGLARSGEYITINKDKLAHQIGTTGNSSTAWCFQWQDDGYSLAVKLESGKISQQGTSSKACNF